jgi:hypothetical protein
MGDTGADQITDFARPRHRNSISCHTPQAAYSLKHVIFADIFQVVRIRGIIKLSEFYFGVMAQTRLIRVNLVVRINIAIIKHGRIKSKGRYRLYSHNLTISQSTKFAILAQKHSSNPILAICASLSEFT